MSLDTVAEDIRDEARARAEEIREEGETRASEIVEDAEADAEEIREEREAAVEREIAQKREQAVSSAKLEAKQARLEARRDALEEVRSAVEETLAGIEGERRRSLTASLSVGRPSDVLRPGSPVSDIGFRSVTRTSLTCARSLRLFVVANSPVTIVVGEFGRRSAGRDAKRVLPVSGFERAVCDRVQLDAVGTGNRQLGQRVRAAAVAHRVVREHGDAVREGDDAPGVTLQQERLLGDERRVAG